MSMPDARWSVIVHGGARTISPSAWERNRAGCLAAVDAAAQMLRDGGTALDAAEIAVRLLEDDATYNAGTGSVPNADGDLELDAAIMDGTTLDVGAVAALRDFRNPVSVARKLLQASTVLLVGNGAHAFALAQGFSPGMIEAARDTEDMAGQHDTVGCVTLDVHGHIAVATSTGGVPGQRPGRVGDAPIPGSGYYADDNAGGVAISGDGESILRSVLASRVIERLRQGSAPQATEAALTALARVGGEAGIIAIGTDGRFGIAHNSDQFSVGLAASWLASPRAGVHRREFEDIVDG